MDIRIAKLVRCNNSNYKKGVILIDEYVLYVKCDTGIYPINIKTLKLTEGKGYILLEGIYHNFIGLKGVIYSENNLYRFKPGDIVKGKVINGLFNIN